ncbi:MAG: NYN domain-containing protein [Verrucomicrobiota bacterium]
MSKPKSNQRPEEHLLIDGYNLLHAWPEHRRELPQDVDGARARFLDQVRIIHDTAGIRTTVVFDGKGAQTAFEYPSDEKTFTVIYTMTGQTADAVIEHLVARSSHPAACSVASRDNLVAESIRASGAILLTTDDLRSWVQRCEVQQETLLNDRRRQARSKSRDDSPWDVLD